LNPLVVPKLDLSKLSHAFIGVLSQDAEKDRQRRSRFTERLSVPQG
jgi:hypothetical protein